MYMGKSMSSDSDTKVVQTELPKDEYERLVRVAEREDVPLKEALRDAVRSFTERRDRHDPDDPFFADPPEAADGEADLSATETDSYLYDDDGG